MNSASAFNIKFLKQKCILEKITLTLESRWNVAEKQLNEYI